MENPIRILFIDKLKLLFYRIFCSERSYKKHKVKFSIPNYNIINQPKLIMVLLIKNEEDIIAQNLEFHKKMGVDGFIVTDNNSTDNTKEILQKYKNKGWILDIINEPSTEYRQAEFVDRMIRLAIENYRPDWIISADSDEFWRAKSGNLKNELSKSKANLLYVPIYNMQDNHEYWLDNVDMIKKEISKKYERKLQAEQKLGIYHQFSRQIPKVIIRATEYVYIHMGNHSADMKFQHQKIQAEDIYIYHYNSRGKKRFITKMVDGGKSLQYDKEHKKGAHWLHFSNLAEENADMEREYQKFTGVLCPEISKLTKKDTFIADFFKLQEIEKVFPKIMSFQEMLEKIKNGASLARFGDATQ